MYNNDWIDEKPVEIKQPETQKNGKKRPKRNHIRNLSSITAPKSFKDLKSQIYSNKSSKHKGKSGAPPPSQGLHDDTKIAYNQRERRKGLNVREHMAKSKHSRQQDPVITGVSAQGLSIHKSLH